MEAGTEYPPLLPKCTCGRKQWIKISIYHTNKMLLQSNRSGRKTKQNQKKTTLQRAHLWFICAAACARMCLLPCAVTFLTEQHRLLVCSLSGVQALQGQGWISVQCCQSPEFLCSQACQLVTPDIARKKKKKALEKDTADTLQLH